MMLLIAILFYIEYLYYFLYFESGVMLKMLIVCYLAKVFPFMIKEVHNRFSFYWLIWSILVLSLECRFMDTQIDGSNPSISMLCP